MKKITKQDDVIYYTAKEAGVSEEFVKFLERSLWYTVLMYLKDPVYSPKGIVLKNFMKFYISPYRIKHALKKSKYKELFQKLYDILWESEKKH